MEPSVEQTCCVSFTPQAALFTLSDHTAAKFKHHQITAINSDVRIDL